MDDIVVRRHGVRGAQQSMDDGFQMFGADGGQAPHPHAVVRVHRNWGSEIRTAIDGDFMPQPGEFVARLLVIGFDAAVFGDQAATPDERDADAAARNRVLRCGRERQNLLGGCEPAVEFQQLLHVLAGVVVCFHATASGGAHLLDQIGAVKQKSDGASELFAIPVGIKEPGDAMFDQFPARAQIGGDDRPSPGIRFQNRFPQGLICVGRKYGEAATGDQLLEFLAVDHAREQDMLQIQFSRQRFEPGTLGTVSCNDQRNVRQLDHRAQEFISAFLGRKPTEVEQVSIIARRVDHRPAEPGSGAGLRCAAQGNRRR